MNGLDPGGLPLAQICGRADFWRRSPASVGGPAGHKEWQYFYVLGDEVELVVNFSIMDRAPGPGRQSAVIEDAQVILLARTADGRWHGDVEATNPQALTLAGGRIDARFGRSTMAFVGDAYRVSVSDGAQTVSARLALRPVSRPALVRSVPLGAHEPLHWLVVPRLMASGDVMVAGRRFSLHDCSAYHDHNWGRFDWGGDFAWEWGVAVGSAAVPRTLVYYRITDRARHAVTAQGLLLWSHDQHERTFRDGEVSVRTSGLLRAGRCLRVPRIMSLAIPGTASDIPSRIEVEGRSGADGLSVVFDLGDCAQIGVPNEHDDGITLISECRARADVRGQVRGATVRFASATLLEFNRAA